MRRTSVMDQTEEEQGVPYYKDGKTEVDGASSDAEDVSATAAGEKKSELKHSKVEVECSTPNTAAEPEVDIQKQQPQQRSAVDGDIPCKLPRKGSVDCDDIGEPTEGQPPPKGVEAEVKRCGSQAAPSEPTATPTAGLNDNSSSDSADMIRRSSFTQDVKPSEYLADTGVEADGEEKGTGDERETSSTGRDQQGGLRKVRRNLTKSSPSSVASSTKHHDLDVCFMEKHNKSCRSTNGLHRGSHSLSPISRQASGDRFVSP